VDDVLDIVSKGCDESYTIGNVWNDETEPVPGGEKVGDELRADEACATSDEDGGWGGHSEKNPAPEKPFIRFMIDHITVHMKDDVAQRSRMLHRIESVLKPHVADKGYDWEFHVDETPREFMED